MPPWTDAELDAFYDRRNRARAELQKRQAGERARRRAARAEASQARQKAKSEGVEKPAEDQARTSTVDGAGDRPDQFSISVVLRISDNRKRDLDGALTTLLDCLVKAGAIPDDSRQHVVEESVKFRIVPKGEEGAEIEIRKL